MKDRGDTDKLELREVRNEEGILADPDELTLRIRQPSGEEIVRTWPEDSEIVHDKQGFFHSYLEYDESGGWEWRWEATGDVALVVPGGEFVAPDSFGESVSKPAVDWAPTVKEVGLYLHARTKDRFGNRNGEFTSETQPTALEVAGFIEEAVGEVTSHLGDLEGEAKCLPRLRDRAKGAVILYAAMLVELSYKPKEVGSGRSPFESFEKLYDKRIKTLIEGVAECLESEGGESVSGKPAVLPKASFPCPSGIGQQVW